MTSRNAGGERGDEEAQNVGAKESTRSVVKSLYGHGIAGVWHEMDATRSVVEMCWR